MLFQRINRSDPERVFVIAKNSYTVALSNGQSVVWDYTTDVDGVGVERPPARAVNGGFAFAGIAAETIGISAYGLIQVYGYHPAARVRIKTSSTPSIALGAPLALNSAGSLFCLESIETGSTMIVVYPGAIALGAYTLWTTTTIPVFIKAM